MYRIATGLLCTLLLYPACKFDTTPRALSGGSAGSSSDTNEVSLPTGWSTSDSSEQAGNTARSETNNAGSGSVGLTAGAATAPVPNAASSGGTAANGGNVTATAHSRRAAPGYQDLAAVLDQPLDGKGTPLVPAPPTGWTWYEVSGSSCRDGSPAGFYVHTGSARKLLIYLEGGGACINAGYCAYNPANVRTAVAGNGETVVGTAFGTVLDRQRPGIYTSPEHQGAPAGIFDFENEQNPFKEWSQVYIPYCTGDLHFGTKTNASVPGMVLSQQFVGHLNMKLFVGKLVPTFKTKVDQVLLTGSSSGAAGAAYNLGMVQDSFAEVPVDLIADAGLPLDDMYMPVCLQKHLREDWGLEDALPPDCTDCRQADGGGLLKITDFWLKKYPALHAAVISRTQDDVMRLFFAAGNNTCATYDTADPVTLNLTLGTVSPAASYTDGLSALRAHYAPTGRVATFWINFPNPNYHQHLFRNAFYEAASGSTIAQWADDFSHGKIQQVGP
jgi:Pectinacetylesterase